LGNQINFVGVKPKAAAHFLEGDAPEITPVVKRSLRDVQAEGKLIDVDEGGF
jgi:hypothetical protein